MKEVHEEVCGSHIGGEIYVERYLGSSTIGRVCYKIVHDL